MAIVSGATVMGNRIRGDPQWQPYQGRPQGYAPTAIFSFVKTANN